MVIYTSVRRIMHYYLTPAFFLTVLYSYTLRNKIYLREPSGNIISNCHGTFIHVFMHWYDPIYIIYKWNSHFSSIHMAVFLFSNFLWEQYIKNFVIIYKSEFLYLLISVKFTSCGLPQANLLQHCIHFLIRKIQVQKPQPSWI